MLLYSTDKIKLCYKTTVLKELFYQKAGKMHALTAGQEEKVLTSGENGVNGIGDWRKGRNFEDDKH